MFLLKRLLAHKYPKQIKIPPVPSPVEVRGPPITPQLLQRQRWSNFLNHKIVERGIADDNRRSQEEAESEVDKNGNNVEHTSFVTESGVIDDNQNFNNDDNVPPKPNIIEDIIHNNESKPVEDLDGSMEESSKLKKESLKDLIENIGTSTLPANQIHELKK